MIKRYIVFSVIISVIIFPVSLFIACSPPLPDFDEWRFYAPLALEKKRPDVILSRWTGRKVPFPDNVACIYGP